MDFITPENRIYILLCVAILLLAGLGWYTWCRQRKNRHYRHVEAVIKSLGLPTLRDVVLPDGLDGLAYIDYLLMTPRGAVVLDVHYHDGHLFGGENVDMWSQVINNRSYKFSNPLYDNEHKCQAVEWNVENIRQQLPDKLKDCPWDTHGRIAFSNAGNFPKGIPDKVCMIDSLADGLAPFIKEQNSSVQGTKIIWEALHNLTVTNRAEASELGLHST